MNNPGSGRPSFRQIGIRRSSPGKGPKLTPFEIRVDFTPPLDSKLTLAYHAGERPCK